jgi:hypothetical protein
LPLLSLIHEAVAVDGLLTFFVCDRERMASQLQLTSDLCDLTVPLSALNWVNLDDGFVGLAGTLSSLIGVYLQWKKTA